MTTHIPAGPYRTGELFGMDKSMLDIHDANGLVIARVRVKVRSLRDWLPYAPGMELAARILKLGEEKSDDE
jgi:hypothetical protein